MIRTACIAILVCLLAACGAPEAQGPRPLQDNVGAREGDAPDAAPERRVTRPVSVHAAWMRPHPEGRTVTAAYFTARLERGSGDTLVGARIDGAESVEFHTHETGPDGMMRMVEAGPQILTGASPLVFAPRGLHLMVFGLSPVVEGEVVTGVLVFESAGDIPVEFAVQAAPPGD